MLQTRNGKRTAKAALKVAVDLASEGLITKEEAVMRVEPASLDQLLHPTIDPGSPRDVIASGLPASPGADGFLNLDAPLPAGTAGRQDLCVRFTGDTRPQMWVLDRITLQPR